MERVEGGGWRSFVAWKECRRRRTRPVCEGRGLLFAATGFCLLRGDLLSRGDNSSTERDVCNFFNAESTMSNAE